MIPGNINTDLISGAEGGYAISRSLRFNSADSAYLSQTPSTAGNRKTWTWVGWVKRSALATRQIFFSAGTTTSGGNSLFSLEFDANDKIRVADADVTAFYQSAAVYRDPSAWLHLVLSFDSTNAVSGSRVKVYVNGVEAAAGSYSAPTLNYDSQVNNNSAHAIGRYFGGLYFSGYLADIHFIDGQALDPTSFGEFSATTGVWVPKAYTGSYGTNGFKLDFSDNSAATATTLGKDAAGSNNWTPNNLSVTAGAGNDSLIDVPVNGLQIDTGLGGQVRGNYCTLNPLAAGTVTLSNGNLNAVTGNSNTHARGTIGILSGKWYWEIVGTSGGDNGLYGIVKQNASLSQYVGGDANGWGYSSFGRINDGLYYIYGASFTNNDVIGVAFDADNGTLTFYKNGISQGQAFSGLTSGPYFPAVSDVGGMNTTTLAINFGQRPFAYTAPSGFKALCTTNLPTPTIVNPSTAMDVKLYTGNGSTQTISGLGFSPDLIWIKKRSGAEGHLLSDTVRGIDNGLYSNQIVVENNFQIYGKVSAVTSSSFTVAATTDAPLITNQSGQTYVAWAWDAGSSTVTNTAGSITSQVRANPSAGFSIVTYTSPNNSSDQTVGHGLGVTPQFIIVKNRDNTYNWDIYHASLGNNASLTFTTNPSRNGAFGTPNSSVFTTKWDYTHFSTNRYVAYCFAPVAGYSAFGSYTGNGSADGPFVYTGFRPRWVMVKSTSYSDTDTNWNIIDTARGVNNVIGPYLNANNSAAEQTYSGWDLLSNGFKLRNTGNSLNRSGVTYIYAAFAEAPFQYALAR
jgi:hypothetical protein